MYRSRLAFKIQGAPVPIDQPPGPLPTEQDPCDAPVREVQRDRVPAQRGGAEPLAQVPADPHAWTSLDTLYQLIGYVLSQDAYVKRLLKIYFSVVGSVTILLAILAAVTVIAPDVNLFIQFGIAILGVGVSGGTVAYLRRRMAQRSARNAYRGPTGSTKE